MNCYNGIGRHLVVPERALEPEQFQRYRRIVPEPEQFPRCRRIVPELEQFQRYRKIVPEPEEPAVACVCSRCWQDVYRDECTYEDGTGKILCRECFEELLHERIRHELPLLAQELGYDVVRHV